mmetsp:Transcript_2217/g.2848  ORF Transcript_2217/g.2848 Transcript_2217/m.2848 type:complete len:101 (-) Transcript_2217:128-430(-)
MPPAKSVSSAPRIVKCHSNMSSSRGAAWYRSEGSIASSLTSAWMRRREGDLLMSVLSSPVLCYALLVVVDDDYFIQLDYVLLLVSRSRIEFEEVSIIWNK